MLNINKNIPVLFTVTLYLIHFITIKCFYISILGTVDTWSCNLSQQSSDHDDNTSDINSNLSERSERGKKSRKRARIMSDDSESEEVTVIRRKDKRKQCKKVKATDQIPKSRRRIPLHQRKLRKYEYCNFTEAGEGQGRKHRTMIKESSTRTLPFSQKIPGYCILCPEQFYHHKKEKMEEHYMKKHYKSSIIIDGLRILQCKCTEGRIRGTDSSTRNTHYHCIGCWKPCDRSEHMALHAIRKHALPPRIFDHILKDNQGKKAKGKRLHIR